jgi:hypothetical protein
LTEWIDTGWPRFSSTLAGDVLYDENSLPRVDGESLRSRRIATTAHTHVQESNTSEHK